MADETPVTPTTTSAPTSIPIDTEPQLPVVPIDLNPEYDPAQDKRAPFLKVNPNPTGPTVEAAPEPSVIERAKKVVTEGIPRYSSRTPANPKYGQEQFLAPEEALTPEEQHQHPVATGALEAAGGLTSPATIGTVAATAGVGEAGIIPKVLSGLFAGQIAASVYDQYPALKDAVNRAQTAKTPEEHDDAFSDAQKILTHMGVDTVMGLLAAKHGAEGAKELLDKTTGSGVPDQASTLHVEAPLHEAPGPEETHPEMNRDTVKKLQDLGYSNQHITNFNIGEIRDILKNQTPAAEHAPQTATTAPPEPDKFAAQGGKLVGPQSAETAVSPNAETPAATETDPVEDLLMSDKIGGKKVKGATPKVEPTVLAQRAPDAPKGLVERTTGDEQADAAIKSAGAIPAGTSLGMALFHDPKTGSTLAFKPGTKITPEAVQAHLAESRQAFGIKPEPEAFAAQGGKMVGQQPERAVQYHPALQKAIDDYGITPTLSLGNGEASYIAPDGKFLQLPPGVEHADVIEGSWSNRKELEDSRVAFLNDTNAIRLRFNPTDRAGATMHISVPAGGVTAEQIPAIQQAIAKAGRNGNVVMERADVTPETKDELTMTKEFPRPGDAEEYLRKIQAHPDQQDIVSKELRTPFKETYGMEITDREGKTRKVPIDAHSSKQALALLVKKFPDASEWRLDAMPEEKTPSTEYAVPSGKIQKMKVSGNRTELHTIRHELGHAMVGLNEGNKLKGMVSSSHPVAPNDMRAGVLWDGTSLWERGANGNVQIREDKRAGIVRQMMGGIAADELFNDIPRAANHNFPINAGGDGTQAYSILTKAGFTHEEAMEEMHKMIDDDVAYLSQPHVSAVLKENEATREKGLSTQFHYSPERLQNMHAEAQRRIANEKQTSTGVNDNRTTGAGAAETGGADVARGEGGVSPADKGLTQGEEGIVSEEKTKKEIPNDIIEDYLDRRNSTARDVIDEYNENINKSGYRQQWSTVPAGRLIKIWDDYAKLGFVRDEKGLDKIADTVLENIHKILVNNVLSGHSQEDPADLSEHAIGERYDLEHFNKNETFFDDESGNWRLTDFAAEPLDQGAANLMMAKTPEDKLQAIDRILNIVHQRSDLSSWFVEGGQKTLNKIAGRPSDIISEEKTKEPPTEISWQHPERDPNTTDYIATHAGLGQVARIRFRPEPRSELLANILPGTGQIEIRDVHSKFLGTLKNIMDEAIKDAKQQGFRNIISYSDMSPANEKVWDSLKDRYAVKKIKTKTALFGESANQYIISLHDDPKIGSQLIDEAAKAVKNYKPVPVEKVIENLRNDAQNEPEDKDIVSEEKVKKTPNVTPEIAQKIVDAHVANGGSTFNLTHGDLAGTDNYAVATNPERGQTLDHPPTAKDIQNFATKNQDLLQNPDKSLGTWHNTANDTHALDVVSTLKNKDKAVALGKKNNQIAIFHLGTNTEIPTGGTGITPLEPSTGGTPDAPAAPPMPKESAKLPIISSRIPSKTVKGETIEEHTNGALTSDMQAAAAAPGFLQKLADRVAPTPGFKNPGGDATAQTNAYIRHAADNIKFVQGKLTPEEIARASQWYPVGAHERGIEVAKQHKVTPHQAYAVTAALSPLTDWDVNTSLAERAINIWQNQQNTKFTPEMKTAGQEIASMPAMKKFAKIYKSLEGKTLGELKNVSDQAHWLRLYDEGHNPREYQTWNPDGTSNGLAKNMDGSPKQVSWSFQNLIQNAIHILKDGSQENISKVLGGAHKVRNFYNNQLAPNDPRFLTIDTHAVAVGQLRPMSGKTYEVRMNFGGTSNKAYGLKGTYSLHDAAYRLAAKELDIPIPSRLQSSTWTKIREVFPNRFKTAENQAAVDAIWKEHTDGKITADEARDKIWSYAEGWNGRATGEVRDSGDQRELFDAGVQRESAGGAAGRGDRGNAPEESSTPLEEGDTDFNFGANAKPVEARSRTNRTSATQRAKNDAMARGIAALINSGKKK